MPEPWYQHGLRFECTRCGQCCSGFPGFVWVTEEEMRAIAQFRGVSLGEVVALYTRFINGKRSLREKLNNDCTFFDANEGCTIYPVRPQQCRTWPFWESTVQTPDDWERTKEVCPGAGCGPLIPVEEITRRIKVVKL